MQVFEGYAALLEEYLNAFLGSHKASIYAPVDYILRLGGKRMRPGICMAFAAGHGLESKTALPVAAAIEVFHNFTLLHDDIMDKADTRRGAPAVHVKWDDAQAILSGDIMFAMSYELLAKAGTEALPDLLSRFTRTAKEVCEGQQLDMEFETRDAVSETEYLEMIRLKTSVLVGASAAMGARLAGQEGDVLEAAYDFGLGLGMSFQIQDDILDSFGEKAAVGKRIGGDILNNKKTLLYIKALEMASAEDRTELLRWYSSDKGGEEKVDSVKRIMQASGSLEALRQIQNSYQSQALAALGRCQLNAATEEVLAKTLNAQMERSH